MQIEKLSMNWIIVRFECFISVSSAAATAAAAFVASANASDGRLISFAVKCY